MPGIFKSYRSTVTPWEPRNWISSLRLLVDNLTGAPIGIESPNANGPDGIFVPVDVTAAQIASPPAAMVLDLNATYRLNVPPYSRYISDGTQLVPIGASETAVIVPAGFNQIYLAPLTISLGQELVVQGGVHVQ